MNKIIVRKIIKEEVNRRIARETFGEEFDYILMEASFTDMLKSGFSSGLSFLEDNLGQGVTDAVKQFVITQIFDYLESVGLPISADSVFGSVLVNVIQNLTASDMADYFSEGGCEKVADRIVMGVQEGLQEDLIVDKIVEIFFGPGAKLEGIVGSPIRELINIKLKDMTSSLRDPLVDFACKHRDFEKLKSDLEAGLASYDTTPENGELDTGRSLVRLRK